MASKYRVGQKVTVLIRGFDLDNWEESGTIAEVREGNPPGSRPCNLETEPYCYRLVGQTRFFRESSITLVKRKKQIKEPYSRLLECVTPLNIPLPA